MPLCTELPNALALGNPVSGIAHVSKTMLPLHLILGNLADMADIKEDWGNYPGPLSSC